MKISVNSSIETIADIEKYLFDNNNIYNSIPDKIKSTLDSKTSVLVKIITYLIAKQNDTIKSMINLIDFDKCDDSVLDIISEVFRIPIPEFPLISSVRTHKITSGVQYPVMTITHDLKTLDYIAQANVLNDGVYIIRPIYSKSYNDIVLIEPSGDVLSLYLYRKTYKKARRLICKNIALIDSIRGTVKCIEYYLRLLLCDEGASISIPYFARTYPFFQYFNGEGSTNGVSVLGEVNPNYSNCWDTSMAYNASPFTSPPVATNHYVGNQFDASGKSDYEIIPRLIDQSGSFENPLSDMITLNITLDWNQDIEDFIKDTITNYLIPFPNILSNSITFSFTNNKTRWQQHL